MFFWVIQRPIAMAVGGYPLVGALRVEQRLALGRVDADTGRLSRRLGHQRRLEGNVLTDSDLQGAKPIRQAMPRGMDAA